MSDCEGWTKARWRRAHRFRGLSHPTHPLHHPPHRFLNFRNFVCQRTQISSLIRAVPSHRGALRNVINAGRDAVDAAAPLTMALVRTAKSCRSDAPWLASSLREQAQATVSSKPGHRGEREVSRKTIARGMPGETGVTVVTTLVCFFSFAYEAAGASSARHSLRPLIFREANELVKTRAKSRRGNAEARRMNASAPHSHSSSPGLTGRPSIPEEAVIESKGRGVLDTPHARGMTTYCGDIEWAEAFNPHLSCISASRAAESSKKSRALPPASGCARLAARL
jgi:hypothetical protein